MKSLYGKFLTYMMLLIIGSTMVAFVVMNAFYQYYLKDNHATKNMERVKALAHYIETEQPSSLSFYVETNAQTGYKMILVHPTGERVYFGDSFRLNNLQQSAVDRVLSGKTYNGMGQFPTGTLMTGFFADESRNTVGAPFRYEGEMYGLFIRPDIRALFTEVHYLLGGMIVIIVLLSVLAVIFVTKKLIDPITKLTHVTKTVGTESLQVSELPVERADEIGTLAQSFRAMIERLEENELARKQFISDVSHDFQSPLSSIQGYARLLEQSDRTEEERRRYATIIVDEASRLSNVTRQLLDLTSYDQLTSLYTVRTFSLDEQLRQVIRTYTWQVMEKQLSLVTDFDAVMIEGDPNALEKVWDNLLSNALKYTEEGTITVCVRERADEVVVSIEDTGCGMTEEEMAHVFDRFYRVDDARTKRVRGTGLGMSIVEQIVRLHDGKIEIDSKKGVGTRISIHLRKKE